ncbi:MAG: hypothetical protein ACXACI_05380 [Candidatus Hodarchaeales archaeon]|jgi:transcription initiation factor IIE alpha subunit
MANQRKNEVSEEEIMRITGELPRSASKVFLALIEKGRMKSKELSKYTALNSRTVRYGLGILRQRNLVHQVPDFNDMRSHYYIAHTSQVIS